MKLFFLLSFSVFFSFLFHTREVNKLKVTAKQYYEDKQYLEAIKIYTQLETKYQVKEAPLIYDHANACYRSLQLRQAYKYYQVIADGNDSVMASCALNQMGIISCRTNKLKEGKELFMQSLRKNSSNIHAVLNLEWAMTLKDDPKSQQERNKTQQEKQKKKSGDSNSPDYKADPSGDENDKEALRSSTHTNKYMDMNKARLLLESMKNSEKQYIQQLPVNTTTKPNEPAW